MYIVVGLGRHCLTQEVRSTTRLDTGNGSVLQTHGRDMWSLEGILQEKFR